MISSSPVEARQGLFDLLMSVGEGLQLRLEPGQDGQSKPHVNKVGLTGLNEPITGWAGLFTALASLRRDLDADTRADREGLDRVRSRHNGLRQRFDTLKHAYEHSRLMIEIFYELIKVGHDFQSSGEILEESAEILSREFKADLFVCRLRTADGCWENIMTGSETKNHTPIFVKYMEETHPNHPVMQAVSNQDTMYVLSNNLKSSERGGDSFGCEAFQEGYRSRLSFILRDPDKHAFGLIMLYSQGMDFFDRYDAYFLEDCARLVSLTVGRWLEVGKDAVAKAAGGMAHVGNNVLGIMKNCTEIVIEDLECFLRKIGEAEVPDPAGDGSHPKSAFCGGIEVSPEVREQLKKAYETLQDDLDLKTKLDTLYLVIDNIDRLKRAIENLLMAVDNPVLMHYLNGVEVLDLEPLRSLQ